MRLLCMDCEGPITLNDNAFEICAHFLPRGEQFFSLVSRYDDYCADVLRRRGYRPGTTLAFIVPFLKAHNLRFHFWKRQSMLILIIMATLSSLPINCSTVYT